MTTANDLKNRTLTLKKSFIVPVETVWKAWTQPEHVAKWWAPNGMNIDIVEHNFKVGGKWKYVMPMPDGSEFISEGEYLVIEEFQKVFSTANFRPMTEGVEMQTFFEESNGTTTMTFNIIHETEEYCRQQEQMGFYNGWGSAFNRLENIVNSLSNN